MKAYTFDMKLDAAVTVNAANADEALRMVHEAMQCADCNGGAWPDGSPILFEASLNQRPNIGLIDGEDVSIVTLHDWDALRIRESVDWEAVARREGWEVVEADPRPLLPGPIPEGPLLYHRNLDRIWPADDWEGAARDLGIGDDGTYGDESGEAAA